MSTFLNIDLSGKIELKFLWKHIWFSFLWLVGLSLLFFRVDILILEHFKYSLTWLRVGLPTFFCILFVITFIKIKWYYKIALLFYPLLMFFWFIPKTVLSKGKIYLFGNYVNSIYRKFKYFKATIIHFFIFLISLIIFISLESSWVRCLMLIVLTYFYLRYLIKFVKKSFKPPSLFGNSIEKSFVEMLQKDDKAQKSWIANFVNQKDDEKFDLAIRKEKQITRLVMANYSLELIRENINGFRGKQAFVISWAFESFIFLFYSVIFFSFANIELYKISSLNFAYTGSHINFDFFYYTLKTMTFGDIDLIKPISIFARSIEIASFFVLGIFVLVILTSIVLSLRQEKVSENIKLATKICEEQNRQMVVYSQANFGTDINTAMKEVKTIDESLKNLKNIIDRLF